MLKVGIIGCGSITKFRHAPEYAANPDTEIAGFFDVRQERAREMCELFGGKVYSSVDEMLADKEIDMVSVCTSNKYHAETTIKALNAGKHVLCEKPMATSAEDAAEMIKAAERNGKFLMIGHNQRLAEAHVKARQILDSGELGKVLSFRTTFGHGGPESWSADKSLNTWFFKKEDAFVGAMGDLGVHKADLIRWLIGDEIDEVMASVATLDKVDSSGKLIEVDDNAFCILKSKSGIIGTLTVSWTNYAEEDNSTILYCTNGVMRIYDNPEFPIVVTKKNKEKAYYKVGSIQTNESQTKSGIIDMFVESVKSGKKPEISGEEGFAALKIILACMESARTGKAVKV